MVLTRTISVFLLNELAGLSVIRFSVTRLFSVKTPETSLLSFAFVKTKAVTFRGSDDYKKNLNCSY